MNSTPFPRSVDQHPVRIDQIMITRFLVALTMLFFHYGRNIYPLNTNVIGPVALAAPVWVSYFFVLSGFLMAYVYCKSRVTAMNATRYWTSRFARVVPTYWLALAAVWMIQDDPLHSDPVALVLSVTLLQAWVPGYPLTLNYPGWAVSVEVFFYVAFPLLFAFFSKRSLRSLALGIAAFWLISQAAHVLLMKNFYDAFLPVSHDLIFYNPLVHLNSFLIGMFGGMLYPRLRERVHPLWNTVLLLTSVGVILYLFEFRGQLIQATGLRMEPNNGLFAPVFIVFMLTLALDRTVMSRILGWRGFVLLGEISFALYILQFPVHIAFEKLVTPEALGAVPLFFYLYLVTVTLLGVVVSRCVEQPLRQSIDRYFTTPHILVQREHL